MPVIVQWDNEDKTAVLINYQRPWTWSEFNAAVEQMTGLFNTVNHKVDVIFDIRNGGFPPPDAMKRFKQAAEISHPNGGLLVFVAPNMMAQFVKGLVQILTRAFWAFGTFDGPNFIFTKSMDEAHAYLINQRKTKAKAG